MAGAVFPEGVTRSVVGAGVPIVADGVIGEVSAGEATGQETMVADSAEAMADSAEASGAGIGAITTAATAVSVVDSAVAMDIAGMAIGRGASGLAITARRGLTAAITILITILTATPPGVHATIPRPTTATGARELVSAW